MKLNTLAGICTFMFAFTYTDCILKRDAATLHLQEQEQRSQLQSLPKLKVLQQKQNSTCNFKSDEFGFGVDSPTCYDVLNTVLSDEFHNTVLGSEGDRLIFQCSAPYIIRWIVTLLPNIGTYYTDSRRENQNPLDDFNVTFTSEFRLIVGIGNSGWVKCQNPLNENQTSELYIFSRSGDDFVANELNELKEQLNVPLAIACMANYPHIRPRLEEEVEDDIYEVVDPERILKPYDPRYGFIVQGTDKQHQAYMCVTEDHEFLHDFKIIKNTIRENLQLITGYVTTGKTGTEIMSERLSDITCESDQSYNIFLKMIRCTSVYHCDWLSVCLEKCYLKYDFEALEKRVTSNRATLTNPYFSGMTLCRVWLGSIRVIKYYFIGLDRLSYFTDNEGIPKNALIRLSTDEREFYVGETIKFLCEISTFLLVSNIQFVIVFKNGTKILANDHLEKNNSAAVKPTDLIENRGFAQRTLELNLTREMSDILCLAPWYNSSKWIHHSISLKPRDVVLPSIDKTAQNMRILYSGQKDQLLHCAATGDPKPTLKWIFPNHKIGEMVTLSNLHEGESTLTFPTVKNIDIFLGIYTCVAFSKFGQDRFKIDVDVKDYKLGAKTITGISLANLGLLGLAAGIAYFGYKYYITKKASRDLTEDEIRDFIHGNEDDRESQNVEPTTPEIAQTKAFKTAYVIAEEDLIIARDFILGRGEYGTVYRGIFHGDAVAVKTTRPNADVKFFMALLLELKTMVYIGEHPHIVTFRGAVTSRIKERIIYVVLELSPLGNLHSYLKKIGSGFMNILPNAEGSVINYENISISAAVVTQANMIGWCEQIADGMDYLAMKRVCHGDLATRNVLVFKNDVVKITDFGLSKQLYNYTNYIKKKVVPLPWRWLAVETIRYMEFSSKSDVWSFGVTMWEIFSLSHIPYPGVTYDMEFLDKLEQGFRMKKPDFAPQSVYELVLNCWHALPDARPTFDSLRDDLRSILNNVNVFNVNRRLSSASIHSSDSTDINILNSNIYI